MGGGLIVGGTVAVVVLITTPIVVLIRESLQRRKNLHMDDDEPEDTPGYQSLASLVKRHQRRVRFAKKNIEYPPSPVPAPWRSAFYEPARQRFETIIVDGVYQRHNISSSGNSIAEF